MKLRSIPLSYEEIRFSVGGVIAAVRDATPIDGRCPALMLIIDMNGGEYARVLVPPGVWPTSRDLLSVGQRVYVEGRTDSFPVIHGSTQVATEIRLFGTYH